MEMVGRREKGKEEEREREREREREGGLKRRESCIILYPLLQLQLLNLQTNLQLVEVKIQ